MNWCVMCGVRLTWKDRADKRYCSKACGRRAERERAALRQEFPGIPPRLLAVAWKMRHGGAAILDELPPAEQTIVLWVMRQMSAARL